MNKTSLRAAALAALLAIAVAPSASAGDIMVRDAYLRVSGALAQTAAAFMVIENRGEADRLLSARSDLSQKVQLHAHQQTADGVMKMNHVETGFALAANAEHPLARGGDHIMFLGLNTVPQQGDMIRLTLTFEKAGDLTIEVPVDNERAPDAAMGHSKTGAGVMPHGTTSGN